MTKAPAKFQTNRYKIVGGFTHSRYPYYSKSKMSKFTNWEQTKINNVRIKSKPRLQIMTETYVTFRKILHIIVSYILYFIVIASENN